MLLDEFSKLIFSVSSKVPMLPVAYFFSGEDAARLGFFKSGKDLLRQQILDFPIQAFETSIFTFKTTSQGCVIRTRCERHDWMKQEQVSITSQATNGARHIIAAGMTSRSCETPDPPVRHGIAFEVEADDRDRARRLHDGPDRIWVCSENDAALQGNKLAAEFINPVECALVKPGLQQHVLAVHISGLAQPLVECLGVLVLESLDAAEIPDAPDFGRLLRARH
jgi:hypothetical protein